MTSNDGRPDILSPLCTSWYWADSLPQKFDLESTLIWWVSGLWTVVNSLILAPSTKTSQLFTCPAQICPRLDKNYISLNLKISCPSSPPSTLPRSFLLSSQSYPLLLLRLPFLFPPTSLSSRSSLFFRYAAFCIIMVHHSWTQFGLLRLNLQEQHPYFDISNPLLFKLLSPPTHLTSVRLGMSQEVSYPLFHSPNSLLLSPSFCNHCNQVSLNDSCVDSRSNFWGRPWG